MVRSRRSDDCEAIAARCRTPGASAGTWGSIARPRRLLRRPRGCQQHWSLCVNLRSFAAKISFSAAHGTTGSGTSEVIGSRGQERSAADPRGCRVPTRSVAASSNSQELNRLCPRLRTLVAATETSRPQDERRILRSIACSIAATGAHAAPHGQSHQRSANGASISATSVRSPTTRAATASPIAAECLNP